MSNEPTPRTDEHQFPCMTWPSQDHPTVVRADFSRKLERELTEVTKQRDALAEALRLATAYPLTESWYKKAIEALATLKPCD